MKHLAKDNNLNYGTDVKMISLGPSYDFKEYIEQNKNKTLFGVLFCTDKWTTKINFSNSTLAKYAKFEEVGFEVACQFEKDDSKKMFMYSMMYNFTLIPFSYETVIDANRWNSLTRIKTSVDNGILRELHKQKTGSYDNAPSIHSSESKYPFAPDRMHNDIDITAILGAFYFFIPCLTVFNVIFANMIKEKDLQLRLGLHVFGISPASHWTAWNITAMIYSLIPAIVFPLFGHFIGLNVFSKSPYILTFLIFFSGSYSMAMVAFIVVTLATNEQQGNVWSYSIIFFSVVMLIILTNPLTMYFMFFNMSSADWVKGLRELFHFIPSFNFALLYGQFGRITCTHFDGETLTQVKGREFEWIDLFINPTGKFHSGDIYFVPSPFQLLIRLLQNMIFYWIIIWYCDHVMPNNRGRTHGWLFFLKPAYWCNVCQTRKVVAPLSSKRTRRHSSVDHPDALSMSSNESSLKQTVIEERNQILEDERDDIQCDGLRILGLAKTYRGGLRALKGVYLEAKDGELLSILGHNGAGKTTLINILTGQLNPSDGDAKICDFKLSKDMEEISKIMGLVPQFDILWNNMTAKEHLQMF